MSIAEKMFLKKSTAQEIGQPVASSSTKPLSYSHLDYITQLPFTIPINNCKNSQFFSNE
jgi:hypothetical protein